MPVNVRKKKKRIFGSVEIIFPDISLFSAAAMRVTPSLPQWGRQPKGSIPLTPLLSDFFINLLIIAIGGTPERLGRKHNVQRAPRSDCLFLFRVSTKPDFLKH